MVLKSTPSKTKIFTSQRVNKLRKTEIGRGCMSRYFFLKGKLKYLAQMITFVDQETTEVQHRIRCAWSAFTKHRQELTSQSHRLQHRLHQFDAVGHTDKYIRSRDLGYSKRTRKTAPHHSAQNASTHHTNKKEDKKTRRKLEEETLATTKSAKILKKISAQMLNATRTAALLSTMTKAQQVTKTILKTGLYTLKGTRVKLMKKMLTFGITNWIETEVAHALRIAIQSKGRWTRKAAEWNPGLNKSSKT